MNRRDAENYIREYQEQVGEIPAAELVYSNVSCGVGREYRIDCDNTIWVTYYTGSDVDGQDVVYYSLEDTDDDSYGNDNQNLAAALRTQPQARQADYPDGRMLDCGHAVHYASQVMTSSRGSSCPDCYDRMSD